MNVKHLDHLNLSVESLHHTAEWYERIFGFELVESGVQEGVRWGVLKSGEAMLCVYEHPGRVVPDEISAAQHHLHLVNHVGFRITDRAAWEQTLEREGVQIRYGGVIEWPHSSAWYVLDPTGHEIEVALWKGDQVAFG